MIYSDNRNQKEDWAFQYPGSLSMVNPGQTVYWAFIKGFIDGRYAITILKPNELVWRSISRIPQDQAPVAANSGANSLAELYAAKTVIDKMPKLARCYLFCSFIGIGGWVFGHWKNSNPVIKSLINGINSRTASLDIDLEIWHHTHPHRNKSCNLPDYNNGIDIDYWIAANDQLIVAPADFSQSILWPAIDNFIIVPNY